MRVIVLVVLMLGWCACRAEVSCYRTAAQAAAGVGELEGGGYRLEFVRADAFGGRSWARVRSCAHPEWPAVVIPGAALAAETPHGRGGRTVANMEHPVLLAGATVRVVMVEDRVRIETEGVTQTSGRVGDRVMVRISGPGGMGEGRLTEAVVRGADLLEVEL